MRKLVLAVLAVFMGSMVMAQSADDYIEIMRSVLQTEKKAAIADVMTLTDAEAEVFWPLYNEFNEKMYTIQSKRVKIIKGFAENFGSLSNEKADELWTSTMDYKRELLNLTQQYYKKFKKIIPAGKAAKYFQAENKIAALIDAELALEIPMIETK